MADSPKSACDMAFPPQQRRGCISPTENTSPGNSASTHHEESRSLLFFAGETIFTNMSFDGVSKRFRRLETAEESFDRQVREGYNFEGLDTLHVFASSCQNLPPPVEDLSLIHISEPRDRG